MARLCAAPDCAKGIPPSSRATLFCSPVCKTRQINRDRLRGAVLLRIAMRWRSPKRPHIEGAKVAKIPVGMLPLGAQPKDPMVRFIGGQSAITRLTDFYHREDREMREQANAQRKALPAEATRAA